MRLTEQQRQNNLRLGLILAGVALLFVLALMFKLLFMHG
jgi:hypothetical protein